MRIAILALQGAFIEHKHMLQQLGVETFEIRQLKDWQQPKDGLILPGGESTVQMRLLKNYSCSTLSGRLYRMDYQPSEPVLE